MRCASLLLALFLAVASSAQGGDKEEVSRLKNREEAHHRVLRFPLKNKEDHDALSGLVRSTKADVWSFKPGRHADVMFSHEDTEAVHQSGLHHIVQVENVQSLIEEAAQEETGNDFSDNYHSVDELYGKLHELANSHNDKAKVINIGKSEHGKDLLGISIGAGKQEIVVHGGQHAREWIAPAALMHSIEGMLKSAELGEADTMSALEDFKITIFPVLNPDGYTYSRLPGNRMWRKNTDGEEEANELGESMSSCFGVDLNRNWQAGSNFVHAKDLDNSVDKCATSYEGVKPFSEKESRAMRDYLGNRGFGLEAPLSELGEGTAPKAAANQDSGTLDNAPEASQAAGKVVAHLDVHSYGEDLIPPGCNHRQMSAQNTERSKRLGASMAKSMGSVNNKPYKYGSCMDLLGYTFGGGAGDWAHFDGKIPYQMSIELRSQHSSTSGGYGFIAPQNAIKPTGNEMLAGIKAMAKQMKDDAKAKL